MDRSDHQPSDHQPVQDNRQRHHDPTPNRDFRRPQSSGSQSRLRQAERQTRKMARGHYENFVVTSVLLPRRLHQPFYNIYAFCRTADDIADQSPSPEVAVQHLDALQQQLDWAFEGRPDQPAFWALAHTISQFDLPQQPFDDLLDAFRQDQRVTSYADFDQLRDYCRRSADPVGRIVLRVCGCFDEDNALLSDQICTGLQLANFWQDIARDRAIGRVYLPRDQMRRFGVTMDMLDQMAATSELRELIASECDRAEQYFCRGLPLANHVPRWFARSVKLFAHGGLSTLQAIRRRNCDVLTARPIVSKWKQAGLITRALLGRL